jgi:hypothetical protein
MNENLSLARNVLAVLALAVTTVSASTTLLETPNARPAALSDAYSAASNDVSAFAYNPASLKTLSSGQASFMYEKGLAQDSFGQFLIGAPIKKVGVGFAVGYYNGGDITLFDGLTEKTVTAKTDLTASMGVAGKAGRFLIGVSGKYVSSQIVESYKATAYAADLGIQTRLSSKLRFGAAAQNFGSKLKYLEEASELPRILRAGLAISLFQNSYRSTLSLEAPYRSSLLSKRAEGTPQRRLGNVCRADGAARRISRRRSERFANFRRRVHVERHVRRLLVWSGSEFRRKPQSQRWHEIR